MQTADTKFKLGDRVKQHATNPDRDYFGRVEKIAKNVEPTEYSVRWHRGYTSWEIETDLEPAPAA